MDTISVIQSEDNLSTDAEVKESSTDDFQQIRSTDSKWRRIRNRLIPSCETSHDFFHNGQGFEQPGQHDTAVERTESEEEINPDERSSDTLEKFLQDAECKIVRYEPASVFETSADFLYYPAISKVEPYEKNLADSETWDPEEDGIFKGRPLPLSSRNLNTVERRFVTERSWKWFDIAGSLFLLVSPLLRKLTRFEIDGQQDTSFTASYSSGGLQDESSTESSANYHLQLYLKNLRFTHHPLYNEEQFLAQKLRESFQTYENLEREGSIDLLTSKLGSYYELYDSAVEFLRELGDADSEDNSHVVQSHKERINDYLKTIEDVRFQLDAAYATKRDAVRQILAIWREIKKVRSAQGYATARVKLAIFHDDDSSSEEERRFEDELKRRIAELLQREHEELDHSSTTVSSSSEKSSDLKETKVRRRIKSHLLRTRGHPGEPRLKLVLKDNAEITESLNERERKRREELSKLRYNLKIRYGGVEAGSLVDLKVSDDFTIDINQGFSLWLRQIASKMEIELSSSSAATRLRNSTVIAKFPVDVPDPESRFEDASMEDVPFSCYSRLRQAPSSVLGTLGSDVTFSSQDFLTGEPKDYKLQAAGGLLLQAGWASDSDGRILSFSKRAEGRLELLTKLREEVQLDPNDPVNVPLLETIETLKQQKLAGHGYGSSSGLTGELFCTKDDLEQNLRFRVLRNRFDKKEFFSDMRMVPNRASEIPRDFVEKIAEMDSAENDTPPVFDDSLTLLEKLRFQGSLQRQRILRNVAVQFRKARDQLTYQDIVAEDQIPTLTTLGSHMGTLFSPKRPLKPIRKETNIINGYQHVAEDVQLNVTIIRALNVPLRKLSSHDTDSDQVSPFVEVAFQKCVQRTTTALGSNPTWNQTLSLPVKNFKASSPTRFDPMQGDELFIQLFDEISVDIPNVDADEDQDTIHKQLHRCWLGSLRIPFTAVYSQIKVEGSFELELPLLPLGYQHSSPDATTTCLVVLICLQPSLVAPSMNRPNLESLESDDMIKFLTSWHAENLKLHKDRAVDPLVINSSGKSMYMGRFLQPLKPPVQLEGSTVEETFSNLCQFVAAIPCVRDGHTIRVWSTAEELMDYLCGSVEDHAILLANFLLYHNYEVFIALGTAIPEGFTAHVLVKRSFEEYWLVSPVSGRARNVTDSNGSLKQSWALLNRENFWLNVQPYAEPSRLQLNLMTSSDWLPLFGRQFSNPFSASVQPLELRYVPIEKPDIEALTERLIDCIRREFMKWRKTSRTKWNRFASTALLSAIKSIQRGSPRVHPNLETVCETYKVFAVPLKVPFSSISGILDLLYATGLHRHRGSEFALAVHVQPFVNNVTSIWIYIASLEKRLLQ